MKNLLLTSFAKHNVCTNFWLCFQICFMVPDHKCSKCFGSSRWLNQDTPAPTICNIRLVVRLLTKILYGRCKQKAIMFKYFPILKKYSKLYLPQSTSTRKNFARYKYTYDCIWSCVCVHICTYLHVWVYICRYYSINI